MSCITTIACYDDGSVKQVCYNSQSREVQIYRAAPDVEDSFRFLRLQKFSFDFRDLNSLISSLTMLDEKDRIVVEIAMKPNRRLAFVFDEQYGIWELGFQKKVAIHKRKAVVVNLEKEDYGECSYAPREAVVHPATYEGFGRFNSIKFKKNEDF